MNGAAQRSVTSVRRRRRASEIAAAILAFSFHALVLLVPISTPSLPERAPPPTIDLELSFDRPALVPEEAPAPELPDPEPETVSSENISPAPPSTGSTEEIEEAQPPRSVLSTALLLDQSSQQEATAPSSPERKLGVAFIPELPSHLRDPVVPLHETVFTDDFAPLDTEILDQWQERDGVIRVVMRTPTGETLCGRAEPWSPFNPLYEPVPIFYRCGGGEKRDR